MVENLDGEYVLQAGSICTAGPPMPLRTLASQRSSQLTPGSWRLVDKIGTTLDSIHSTGGVVGWKEKLKPSMERYFRKLKADKPVQRNNVSSSFASEADSNFFLSCSTSFKLAVTSLGTRPPVRRTHLTRVCTERVRRSCRARRNQIGRPHPQSPRENEPSLVQNCSCADQFCAGPKRSGFATNGRL